MRVRHVAILMILAMAEAGCGADADDRVSTALTHMAANAPDGSEIRLGPLTGFAWTSFVAFGPYTTRAQVDESLGFAWPGFDKFGLQASDRFTLLVFVRADTVVHVEEHGRCRPDFAPDALGRRVSQESAVFTLQKVSDCNVLHLRSAV